MSTSEIRSSDPDASRAFYGELFGWTFPEGGFPDYTYVETGIEGAIPGGISPLQGGAPTVTFFVGVPDVEATLQAAAARAVAVLSRPATDDAQACDFGLFADFHALGQVVVGGDTARTCQPCRRSATIAPR